MQVFRKGYFYEFKTNFKKSSFTRFRNHTLFLSIGTLWILASLLLLNKSIVMLSGLNTISSTKIILLAILVGIIMALCFFIPKARIAVNKVIKAKNFQNQINFYTKKHLIFLFVLGIFLSTLSYITFFSNYYVALIYSCFFISTLYTSIFFLFHSYNCQQQLNWEQRVIHKLFDIYCQHHHNKTDKLCIDCEQKFKYTINRTKICDHYNKLKCTNCSAFCYTKEKPNDISNILKWSEKRMFKKYPYRKIMYFFFKLGIH